MNSRISPGFPPEKLDNPSFDDLVDVFKDRFFGWILEPAKQLNNSSNGYFASLILQMTYFEGIWSYKTGEDSNGKSRLFFRSAFQEVFQTTKIDIKLLERVANILYDDARCGFFHEASLRSRIFLAETSRGEILVTLPKKADATLDMEGEIASLIVNPVRFLSAIENHFIGYILQLRNKDNTTIRNNFFKIAKQKWDWETDGVIIGVTADGICHT